MNTRLHRISLRFLDADLERLYNENDYKRLLMQCRIACFVGIFSYQLVGFFYQILFPAEAFNSVAAIHPYGLLLPFLVLLMTFTPLFKHINAFPMALIGLSGGISILAMSTYIPAEKVHYYYPFLVAVVFFTYNLIGTRFIYALAVDITLLVLFNVTILLVRQDTTVLDIVLSNYLLFVSNLIGGAAGYLTERQRRQLFISQMALQQEVEKARAAELVADNASADKSRFLATVSHDLRQPIHVQGLFLSMLKNTPLDNVQQTFLSHIIAASDTTNNMLHSLMDYYQIEYGLTKPVLKMVSLQSVFNKIEKEFLGLADIKGLDYRCRETDIVIHTDPNFIEIILRNLVANAIRYTDKGGVLLAARRRGQFVAIQVWDTGIGIEASQQQAIFKEFNQVDGSDLNRTKGLGLGLAIVDALCRKLDYPLSLRSRLGVGSVFKLSIPISTEKANTDAPKQSDIAPLLQQPSLAGMHILLIEDDETIRFATQKQFIEWRASCDAVDSLEAAAALAQKKQPNLIISDYHLRSSVSGIEVISALRLQLKNPALPAILITGDNTPAIYQQAHWHNIDLLHKPIVSNELFQHIIELIHPA